MIVPHALGIPTANITYYCIISLEYINRVSSECLCSIVSYWRLCHKIFSSRKAFLQWRNNQHRLFDSSNGCRECLLLLAALLCFIHSDAILRQQLTAVSIDHLEISDARSPRAVGSVNASQHLREEQSQCNFKEDSIITNHTITHTHTPTHNKTSRRGRKARHKQVKIQTWSIDVGQEASQYWISILSVTCQ